MKNLPSATIISPSANPSGLLSGHPSARALSLRALAVALACLPAAPALAQSTDAVEAEPEEVIIISDRIAPSTITVWGERSFLYTAPANVAVVDQVRLEQLQTVTIADALTRIPGVTATSNGQLGSFTALRIRGADAAQTLVVIDGVRVGDPSSPGGGFDFGNLTSNGVARVEVLNGSNSLAWGSDAIGGVVVIETKFPTYPMYGQIEGGSHDQARASLGGSRQIGRLDIGGNLAYLRTDGISAASAGSEADGFRQFSANGRANLDLGPVQVNAAYIHASGHLALDGYAPPTYAFGDTADYQETQENYASLGVVHSVGLSGTASLRHSLTASLADINRDSFDPTSGPAPSFAARGRTDRIGWTGQLTLGDPVSISAGVEHERSRMATTSAFAADRQRTANSAGWLMLRLEPVNGLWLGGGVRRSDHRDFGGNSVFTANAAWTPQGSGAKLRASFAEGYKAPTLFQLSADPAAYGNPALRPERSRSYDAGVDYAFDYGQHTLSLTLFRRDSVDLIDFVGCAGTGQPAICAGGTRPFGTYANIARARAEGVEASAAVELAPGLRAGLGYAHVATRDRTPGRFTTGNRLARRPVDTATLSLDYAPRDEAYSFGGDVRYVGASFDDAGNSIRLGAYTLVGLRGTVRISGAIILYGRIDNLLDENYENVATYATYGRTFALGVRWQM